MLSKVNSFFLESKQHILNLMKGGTKTTVAITDICCIRIFTKELFTVYARKKQNKMDIIFCESYPYENFEQLSLILQTLVKKHDLKNIRTSMILQSEDYQLLVTDALPVPPAEFQAAIRFKVKELLHYPINDVVIDQFPIPKIKADSPLKIMIVAAKSSHLVKLSNTVKKAGLDLEIIDIPELALRNITSIYEKENQSAALIYIQEKSIELLITFQKQIYIVRKLMFSLGPEGQNVEVPESEIERLSSEIQRSFGYFQSQWRQPPPACVIFASAKTYKNDVIELLSQHLKIPVEALDLSSQIESKKPLTNQEIGKYLSLIGGILRTTD